MGIKLAFEKKFYKKIFFLFIETGFVIAATIQFVQL